jgi:hypothetical protein
MFAPSIARCPEFIGGCLGTPVGKQPQRFASGVRLARWERHTMQSGPTHSLGALQKDRPLLNVLAVQIDVNTKNG